jgi:NADH-quinone oxidoreductase subunit A
VSVGSGLLLISWLCNPQNLIGSLLKSSRRNRQTDLETYECGMPILDSPRHPFSVKFYLLALAFVLFDIETVFLFPWAVHYKQLALFGLIEMGIFILILAYGWLYIWRKGALEWK